MKIKIFKDVNSEKLELAVNIFLSDIDYKEILHIKYSITSTPDNFEVYSVLITYLD